MCSMAKARCDPWNLTLTVLALNNCHTQTPKKEKKNGREGIMKETKKKIEKRMIEGERVIEMQ